MKKKREIHEKKREIHEIHGKKREIHEIHEKNVKFIKQNMKFMKKT